MKPFRIRAVAVAAAITSFGRWAAAQEAPCPSPVTRSTVVTCALRAILAVQAERDELDAARARHVAVSPLLPANPTLSVSVARRSVPGEQATNFSATLAQELEIAGQRGLRRDSALADVDAQKSRVLVSQREVAAEALAAYYAVIAAREEQALAARLVATTKAVSAVAHAKADKGLIAPVDADVADAAMVRVSRTELAASRQLRAALASLTSMLGLDPASTRLDVEGALEPIPEVDRLAQARGTAESNARPEVLALEAEKRAMELRASAFRRRRVPNPTISAFVENDGFNERVLGLGLSIPIPLPGNVGPTYIGEAAEADALAHRAATERERAKRHIRLAVAVAARSYESRRLEVAAFSVELLNNAETSLRALGQEVESGRLTVREAIVAQQTLIELLQGYVVARRDWCFASVDLARAAGLPLERGAP